jgi:hypothetical protein
MVANIPFYNAGHLYSPLGMKIYNNINNNNPNFKDHTITNRKLLVSHQNRIILS